MDNFDRMFSLERFSIRFLTLTLKDVIKLLDGTISSESVRKRNKAPNPSDLSSYGSGCSSIGDINKLYERV